MCFLTGICYIYPILPVREQMCFWHIPPSLLIDWKLFQCKYLFDSPLDVLYQPGILTANEAFS